MVFVWSASDSWRRLLRAAPTRSSGNDLWYAFCQTFTSIRVFHGARPLDPSDYYRTGLAVSNRVALRAVAERLFLSGHFPDITPVLFEESVAAISTVDDGRSFVSLDDTELTGCAGHYLIYGSEFICGIAAGLSRRSGRDYRQVLKQLGKPTIFTINLPPERVSDYDRRQFVEMVSRELRRQCRGLRAVPPVEFTFRLRLALEPSCIVGHSHPKRILDPLNGMTPYFWQSGG